jgi:MFS family permease
VAGAATPLIAGGILTKYAGWQSIFYVNVPIGVAALALALPRIVPDSRLLAPGRRFDALGAIVGTGGLVLLVDAISQSPQYGWGATRTIVLLVGSVAVLIAFLVIESRVKDPLLPLSIFRLRMVAAANVAGLLNTSTQIGGAIGQRSRQASRPAGPAASFARETRYLPRSPVASNRPSGCSGRPR